MINLIKITRQHIKKAQYKYKSYKLTRYIMETYHFSYTNASIYVSWYIKNYNIKKSRPVPYHKESQTDF